VRSTGAGMGCPDWPKCFGQWVPPTSLAELPENYKEINSQHRQEKNARFASYLSAFGFKDTAEKILEDDSIKEEVDFNPVKTWIEYVNRIVGVIIGLLIFAVFVASIKLRKKNPSLTIIAFITFVLVGVQGWIGSIVVSTNLLPWTITVHMFLALVIVGLLIYLVYATRAEVEDGIIISGIKPWLIGSIVVLLTQIILGTQVREALDRVAAQFSDRDGWISSLGVSFLIHRSFSWVVLMINAWVILKLIKTDRTKGFGLALIVLVLGTILSGSGMAYFSVPALLQPIHLLLATVTFGILFLLVLQVSGKQKKDLV